MAVVVAELVNERQLREAELAAFRGKLELSLAVMADRFGELSTQHSEQLQMVAQQVRRLMTAAEGDMALWLGQVRGELANLQGGISQQHSFIQHTNHLLQTNNLLATTNNHLVQTLNDGLTVVLGQTAAVAEQNRAIAFVAAQNLALVNEQRVSHFPGPSIAALQYAADPFFDSLRHSWPRPRAWKPSGARAWLRSTPSAAPGLSRSRLSAPRELSGQTRSVRLGSTSRQLTTRQRWRQPV